MQTATQFNLDALDKWTDEVRYTVEPDATIAYAEATNDDNPRYLSGELAPPVFAIVPVFACSGPAIFDLVPGELMMRVVHGEQDMFFRQPIRPGMELVSRAKPVGVHAQRSGVTVVTYIECKTAAGELVNEQWMTSFFRGAEDEVDVGEQAPPHRYDEALRSPEPVALVAQSFDADQTFRYSEASGDPMPIHLDDEFAKAMGFPGIIIHGLCTMAFTSRAAVTQLCDGEPERLKRLAVRFSKVALPEQELTTTFWSLEPRNGTNAFAFESTTDGGDLVIKDGLAEVAPV